MHQVAEMYMLGETVEVDGPYKSKKQRRREAAAAAAAAGLGSEQQEGGGAAPASSGELPEGAVEQPAPLPLPPPAQQQQQQQMTRTVVAYKPWSKQPKVACEWCGQLWCDMSPAPPSQCLPSHPGVTLL